MKNTLLASTIFATLIPLYANANNAPASSHEVSGQIITDQRKSLYINTLNKGFGPQSPRDIDSAAGNNRQIFNTAPDYKKMNLCNIHIHKTLNTKEVSLLK